MKKGEKGGTKEGEGGVMGEEVDMEGESEEVGGDQRPRVGLEGLEEEEIL